MVFENQKEVLFNIASGQKLIKNPKNGPFWRVFENMKLAVKQCYQTGHISFEKNYEKGQN